MLPYDSLVTRCHELHHDYLNSDDPSVGFKLGSVDEQNHAIVFYFVAQDQMPALERELRATGVRFRFVIHEPQQSHSNVSLLDIDL